MTLINQECKSSANSANTTMLENIVSYITPIYNLFFPPKLYLNKIYNQQVTYFPYKGDTDVQGINQIGGLKVTHGSAEGGSSTNMHSGTSYIKTGGLFHISLGGGYLSLLGFGGNNNIYFDPFKNKIHKNMASTIEHFNPSKDKILLSSVSSEDIVIKQTTINCNDYTCLEIKSSALCLSGDINLTADNIVMV